MKRDSGPLTGLKVIEVTHIMAGPTCGLMLADMGADVIKVERLPDGDDTRRTVPPTIPPGPGGESAAFMMMNRNKRGIALNLRSSEGRTVLHRLLQRADVLVENLRTGAMDAMGFDYDTLHAANPGLIYCSLTGFGRTGPYAERGGVDLIAQGMSGLMSITRALPRAGGRAGAGQGRRAGDGHHRRHPGGDGGVSRLHPPSAQRGRATGRHLAL